MSKRQYKICIAACSLFSISTLVPPTPVCPTYSPISVVVSKTLICTAHTGKTLSVRTVGPLLFNMMDWRTEMEMDGDAFNNTLKTALDFYSPTFIPKTAISQTRAFYSPKTSDLNTFTQDDESSPSAGDGQNSNSLSYLPQTTDEKSRLLMRRIKNKVAATKCRNKKKLKINQLINQAKMIEERNIQLRQTVAKLDAEKTHLVKMLMRGDNGAASGQQMENILNSSCDAIDGLFTLKEDSSTETLSFNLGDNTAGNTTGDSIWDYSYPGENNRGSIF